MRYIKCIGQTKQEGLQMTPYQAYLDQMFDAMSRADQLRAVKQTVAKPSAVTWSDIAKLAKEIQKTG